MSTINTIPLEKNKEIAALVADKQPGDRIYFCATIKEKSDQSLAYRIEEITDNPDELPRPDEYDEEGDKKPREEEGEGDNGSSPDETEEAIKLASPGGYEGP